MQVYMKLGFWSVVTRNFCKVRGSAKYVQSYKRVRVLLVGRPYRKDTFVSFLSSKTRTEEPVSQIFRGDICFAIEELLYGIKTSGTVFVFYLEFINPEKL